MKDLKILYGELVEFIGADSLICNAPMKGQVSFRAGGHADLLVIPKSSDELAQTLKILAGTDIDFFIMGNGSNLLVRDGGFRGVIIKIGKDFASIAVENYKIRAGAGAVLSSVAAKAAEHGLTGFEFASGIPGSIGGAAFMNAGAYGGEMCQVVESVLALCRDGSREYTLSGPEMQYSYRKSLLMERGDIALSVTLQLNPGNREEIAERMQELTRKRNEKQPLSYPSAGSFFKRPPGNYAGKLIEEAGMKGFAVGGARVSPLHAGFIINEGNASASDILALMKEIQDRVYANSGILLSPEVCIIGEDLT